MGGELFDLVEEGPQLDVITHVPITYYDQAALGGQYRLALLEQAHCQFIADHLLLVEGWVAEDQIGAAWGEVEQAIGHDKLGLALWKGQGKVGFR